jgi:hypothetical protein
MNIQVLGFVLVSGVFAIGLLIIGVYMIFDKTPSRKIPMPPRYLKENIIMKTDIEIRDKLMSLTTNNERRKLLFKWVKTGVVNFKQFDALIYYCA